MFTHVRIVFKNAKNLLSFFVTLPRKSTKWCFGENPVFLQNELSHSYQIINFSETDLTCIYLSVLNVKIEPREVEHFFFGFHGLEHICQIPTWKSCEVRRRFATLLQYRLFVLWVFFLFQLQFKRLQKQVHEDDTCVSF
jgi:hypothetical protein